MFLSYEKFRPAGRISTVLLYPIAVSAVNSHPLSLFPLLIDAPTTERRAILMPMQLSDFHYDIPPELIANQPPAVRGTSRLLTLNRRTGVINDRHYPDIVDYLNAGDVLVINDTKVLKARLRARKPSGGERELVLVEQHGSHETTDRKSVV